jgi:hypothetical protein
VDFVVQRGAAIIPIEAKTGEAVKTTSLVTGCYVDSCYIERFR